MLESLVRESKDEGQFRQNFLHLTDTVVLCPPVDERKEKSSLPPVSNITNATATKSSQITASKPSQILATPAKTVSVSTSDQTPPANTTPITTTPVPAPVISPSPLQLNLANVDLGKISSILSSISNAMKTTGEFSNSREQQTSFKGKCTSHICVVFMFRMMSITSSILSNVLADKPRPLKEFACCSS